MTPDDLRRPIKDAPRNGRFVRVGNGVGREYIVKWSPTRICENTGQEGVWEGYDPAFTWTEHLGMGPTYFVDLPDYVEIVR